MNFKLKGKIVERFGTATNFSKVVGVREAIISRVIHGHKDLPQDEQKKWASTLGTKREYLFDNA